MQSVFQPNGGFKLEENTNLCSPLFLGKSSKVKFYYCHLLAIVKINEEPRSLSRRTQTAFRPLQV